MPANLDNSAVATGLEKGREDGFHSSCGGTGWSFVREGALEVDTVGGEADSFAGFIRNEREFFASISSVT